MILLCGPLGNDVKLIVNRQLLLTKVKLAITVITRMIKTKYWL